LHRLKNMGQRGFTTLVGNNIELLFTVTTRHPVRPTYTEVIGQIANPLDRRPFPEKKDLPKGVEDR